LTGLPVPALVPTVPVFKEKRKVRSKKPIQWVWRKFKNSGRADGVLFLHWAKSTDAEDNDYPFAKFNKKIKMIEYNDDEYEQHLKELHPGWTKEETDQLFVLCKRYDLRFTVIYDRFEQIGVKQKTMEDVKERYYGITRKLVDMKLDLDDESLKQNIIRHPYNKQLEINRKLQLENFINRTKEQIKLSEGLINEANAIEANRRKQDKEMKRILKIASNSPLGTPPQTLYANHTFNTNYASYSPANVSSSSTSTSPQSDFSTPDSPLTSNHKKKQASSQRKGPISEAKPRGRGRPANQPPPPPLPLPALPPPLPGTVTTYMRSSRPLSYRMNELNTIDDVFHELGILNQPRTAPGMNKLYEDLYIDVVKLLEVKHTVQQLEEDANKIKTKITPKQPPTPTTIVIPSSKKKEKKTTNYFTIHTILGYAST